MEVQGTCQIGGEKATRFCTCAGELTVLCDSCVGVHEEQYMGEIHGYEQLAYLGLVQSLGLEEFLQRKSQVLKASALGRKLQELETRQYQETRRKVQELTQAYLEHLDTLHGSFGGLYERFSKEKLLPLSVDQPQTLAFTSAILTSGLTKIPENATLVEKKPAEVLEAQLTELTARMESSKGPDSNFDDFFTAIIKSGLKPASPVQPSVTPGSQPVPVHLPPAPPGPFAYIPFSRGPQLAKWRSDNEELERVTLQPALDFTNLTVSVLLPDGSMVSCGGKSEHDCRAVHINTITGEVTFLPEMLTARANSGIAYVEGVIYLFGGFCEGGKEHDSGEKFTFAANEWTQLENRMASSRFQFTPYPHQQTIYIAGGWHTTAVEAFDIPTETFTTLPLVLPKPFGTTCLVYNDELVVLQENHYIRWPLNSQMNESQKGSLGETVKDSNVVVQILGDKAYYTHETKQVCDIHELNLTTWTVVKRAGLSPGGSGGGSNPQCPVS